MGKVAIRSKRTALEVSLQTKADSLQSQIEEARAKWKELQAEREGVLAALKGWEKACEQALAYVQRAKKNGGVSENGFNLSDKMLDEAFAHIDHLKDRLQAIESGMDATSEHGKEITSAKEQLEIQHFRNQFSHHRSKFAQETATTRPVETRDDGRSNRALSHSIDALIELREAADYNKPNLFDYIQLDKLYPSGQ